MNDRFAGKLSLNAYYSMQKDWKGRKRKALLWMDPTLPHVLGIGRQVLDNRKDGGGGWDGSLILSNAMPVLFPTSPLTVGSLSLLKQNGCLGLALGVFTLL